VNVTDYELKILRRVAAHPMAPTGGKNAISVVAACRRLAGKGLLSLDRTSNPCVTRAGKEYLDALNASPGSAGEGGE
jgi:hypothetical protein